MRGSMSSFDSRSYGLASPPAADSSPPTYTRRSSYSRRSIMDLTGLKPARGKLQKLWQPRSPDTPPADAKDWANSDLSAAIRFAGFQMGAVADPTNRISPTALGAPSPHDDGDGWDRSSHPQSFRYSHRHSHSHSSGYSPRYSHRYSQHVAEPLAVRPPTRAAPPPPPSAPPTPGRSDDAELPWVASLCLQDSPLPDAWPDTSPCYPDSTLPAPSPRRPPPPPPSLGDTHQQALVPSSNHTHQSLPLPLPSPCRAPPPPPQQQHELSPIHNGDDDQDEQGPAVQPVRPMSMIRTRPKTPVRQIGQLERAARDSRCGNTGGLGRMSSVCTIARQYRELVSHPHILEADSDEENEPDVSCQERRRSMSLESPGSPRRCSDLAPSLLSEDGTLVAIEDELVEDAAFYKSSPTFPPSPYHQGVTPAPVAMKPGVGLDLLTRELSSAMGNTSDASRLQLWVMIQTYEQLREQIAMAGPGNDEAKQAIDSWLQALHALHRELIDDAAMSDSEYED